MRPGESEARPPRVIDSVRTPRAPPSSKESAEPRRNDSVPIEARARIGKAVVYPLQRAEVVSSHSSLGNSMPEAQTQAGGEQEGFASKREVSQLKEEVKGMRQDLNRVFAMVEAMHTAMLTSTKYQPHVPHEEPSSVAATPRLHEPPVAATSIQTGFSGPSPQGPIFGVGWPSP